MLLHLLLASSLLTSGFARHTHTVSVVESEVCTTALAKTKPKHTPIPTTTLTVHHHTTVTKHFHTTPVKTKKAKPVTTTRTSVDRDYTTVTARTSTDTVVTVSTSTTTSISYETDVSTTTVFSSTAVTSTTSTNVPTSSGFIDAYDSSGDETCGDAVSCGGSRKKREPAPARSRSTSKHMRNPFLGKNHPQSVKCTLKIETIHYATVTSTAKKSTTTVTPTIQKATTTTSIITRTFVPHVSKTVTRSTVTTAVEQSTISTTTTLTQVNTYTVSTTVSSYDACATNNMLGPAITPDGQVIDFTYTDFTSYTTVANALDCCGVCAADATCQFALFDNNGDCFVTYGDVSVCPAGGQATFYHQTPDSAPQTLVVFNGACGTWVDGGQG